LLLALAASACALLLSLPAAASAKEVVDYFGTDPALGSGALGGEFNFPGPVALNEDGVGPADPGDVYVIDRGSRPDTSANRIQRFSRDENGTPGEPYDDTYSFVSAWGAGVLSGGEEYEICTVAVACRAAQAASGNGALSYPTGIAVDQDTGWVYVADTGNGRVNVYEGDGTFLRSFGYDVVASGPGLAPAPDEEQLLTIKASGGKFSLSYKGKATGPRGTGRRLSGSSVVSFLVTTEGQFEVGQGVSGEDIQPGTTITQVGNGTLTLSLPAVGDTTNAALIFGETVAHDAGAAELQAALNALPSIGGVGGSVTVSGGPGDLDGTAPYRIVFGGSLAGDDVAPVIPSAGNLTRVGGGAAATVSEDVKGGAYEQCVAADGDLCQAGGHGAEPGEFGILSSFANQTERIGIAVSPPDGNPASGTVFLADGANRRVGTYDLDGGSPSSFGSEADFGDASPEQIAVDSRGIVYASNDDYPNGRFIERYDSEDANGMGVGFLDPIANGVNERQQVTVSATGGQFRLAFEGHETVDLPVGTEGDSVEDALIALSTIGPLAVSVEKSGNTYNILFRGGLEAKDVPELVATDGAAPLTGGGVAVATISNGRAGGIDERQQLTVSATGGQFRLAFEGHEAVDLPVGIEGRDPTPDAVIDSVEEALAALPTVGPLAVSDSNALRNVVVEKSGSTYLVTFRGGLAAKDVPELVATDGTAPLTGGSVAVATTTNGHAGLGDSDPSGLAVDPDSDGAGPDSDVLYVLNHGKVQQFGPINAPGLSAPPSEEDERHGRATGINPDGYESGLAVDGRDGRLYASSPIGAGQAAHGVYVFDTSGQAPGVSIDSVGAVSPTSATVHGAVDPNGPPLTRFWLEYSTDGSGWQRTGETPLGTQEDPQPIAPVLDPPGGLEPSTLYHVRLAAAKPFSEAARSSALTFTTLAGAPLVETTGSPVRSATTVRFDARVNPRNSATTYHFEYGDQGPCDANPCQSSDSLALGSGGFSELVSRQVTGLAPSTTYHYRVVADNGAPGSPSFGEEMTVTTRASDAPLEHGHLPGPPGSDRAYEQVSLPDAGGNPVYAGVAMSDDGERAVYGVFGGSPSSVSGNAFNQFFAERGAGGWQTTNVYPPREDLVASGWIGVGGRSDLSEFSVLNTDNGVGKVGAFRISPTGPSQKLFEAAVGVDWGGLFGVSDDASRILMRLAGTADPGHPVSSGENVYDVSSGAPKLLSLLPDGSVSPCGVDASGVAYRLPSNVIPRDPNWISAGGERFFFPSKGANCSGESALYMRAIEAGLTTKVSGPALAGPECGAAFIRSTAEEAFFWTKSKLDPADTVPGDGCAPTSADGDVYTYGIEGGATECLTCPLAGADVDVSLTVGSPGSGETELVVSHDGSRLYFRSPHALLPGAAPDAHYRLMVASGELAYVGALGADLGTRVGSSAVVEDGSVVVFSSAAASLDATGGQQNGGTLQFYRYDDRDRSLACVSCPQDGSSPVAAVKAKMVTEANGTGPNVSPLSADGETFAFATPAALLDADQNTPGAGEAAAIGTDVYEWRDGRVFLVTDGLTNWPVSGPAVQTPEVNSVSRSGKDVYFLAAAQYTADALDDYTRLYDARIGGGFEFPPPPKPCPLEVCQGTPKGAPEEEAPGSRAFAGPGNAAAEPRTRRCPKGKRRVRRRGKVRCVGRGQARRSKRSQAHGRSQRQANYDRKASR